MLKLVDIKKDYLTKENKVVALKGVSLSFRQNEFASILGASGCGKTTLLNIIGGLDRYTSGDLIIDGKSTKDFKDSDWDTYRNKKIGFIFQSYHLIPHLSVLQNVELSLTISGVSSKERKKKAMEALKAVGLEDKADKTPNQLSGGQMQRVSIARALINDPEIILADEPTGALDSSTGEQIMELLASIAKNKLVIMVTHNLELANLYSTRIIRLHDGEVLEDTDPISQDEEELVAVATKTSKEKGKVKATMSFLTAINLSFNNLLTKKVRTFITAIAGSIGIIGVGLVLALSNGFNAYINQLQSGSLGSVPILVSEMAYEIDIMKLLSLGMTVSDIPGLEAFPSTNFILPKKTNVSEDLIGSVMEMVRFNKLTGEYLEYIDDIDRNRCSLQYTYPLDIHLISKDYEEKVYFPSITEISFQQLLGDNDFLKTQYDLKAGRYPEASNEVVIILDKYNQVDIKTLRAIGVRYAGKSVTFDDLLTDNLKVVYNNGYYEYDSGRGYYRAYSNMYALDKFPELYEDTQNTSTLKVCGVIRIKENIEFPMMMPGIGYTSALVDDIYQIEAKSEVVIEQQKEENKERDVTTGTRFSVNFDFNQIVSMDINEYLKMAGVFFYKDDMAYMLKSKLAELGGVKHPTAIYLYPKTFSDKEEIKSYLEAYNATVEEDYEVIFLDMTEVATGMASSIIDVISIILICFAGISLVVSSIMISIVTYVSVIERINEIGILRSIGARKLDICNVFNAETTLTGFIAGTLGIIMTYLLCIPANAILRYFTQMDINLAALKPLNAFLLVVVSIVLSFTAGLIPAIIAAGKNPVEALRTD